ncbi:glycosyltransferase family 4 protein [Oscillatoria sp. FACHB-1406]|uniref:glycosyltransferase family 4 protein n=1 Tax=Oscillatoria sp. FACHB-1406 TaxID=2692846 RepID=UPI0016879058|nr:glycosyltransferase family 4 protein [Oscillatoria sp. FACHB-1406]MBD2578965.1 glycosyltransferase family 4 protein [Oscillatoria sp. FACHB-1406]
MKILSITNCPLDESLGSGKTVIRWSEGLRKLGHEVDVLEPKDYQIFPQQRRALKFRSALGAWQFIKKNVSLEQYDLMECYGDEFWLLLRQLSQQKKRPFLVAHTNGLELLHRDRERIYHPPKTLKERAYSLFAEQTHARFSRIAFERVDAFVSICELDRAYVLDRGLYPPNRTAVIEPGLDPEFLDIPFNPQRQHRVAYLGSWTERKDLDTLCLVARNLLIRYPDLKFDLFGTNIAPEFVYSAFPETLHPRLVVRPRLETAEMAKGLAQAKVFFLPSQYEGFGMATAEAMACGCAAVTTPTGFGGDLKSGEDAIICNFSDAVAMESAIAQLLENEAFRLKIARAGYERAQKLRWDSAVSQLESVYQNWVRQ